MRQAVHPEKERSGESICHGEIAVERGRIHAALPAAIEASNSRDTGSPVDSDSLTTCSQCGPGMLFRWFHFWTAAIDFPVASATG